MLKIPPKQLLDGGSFCGPTQVVFLGLPVLHADNVGPLIAVPS